jgi:lactate dehydrogenase-like 2-hydroxyacid dehydrogenase
MGTRDPDAQSLVQAVDVINLQMPLYPSTENFFDDDMFAKTKRGAYLINTARGKLVDRDAVVRALGSGQLAGYAGAGDVWYPQPAPKNHPWRPSSRLIPVAGFDGAGLRRKTEPMRATATKPFPACRAYWA